MRPFASFFAGLALCTASGFVSPAWADLQKGEEAITAGHYKMARRALEESVGAQKAPSQLKLAELELLLGAPKKAETIARQLLKQAAIADDAQVLISLALRKQGKYSQALQEVERAYKKNSKHLGLRHAYGLALMNVGKLKEADVLWNLFFDDFAARKLDDNNALHHFYVGEAAAYLGSVQDARDEYQEAVEIDPNFHRANLRFGQLFASKYNDGDAEQSYKDILKINPKHPDALAALAHLKVDGNSYDTEAALQLIADCLKIVPNHAEALDVRASIEIDRNQWKKAEASIKQALLTNPDHFAARASLATLYWLLDKPAAYEKERKRVMAINPKNSEFYQRVMHSVIREHRYEKAVELGLQAVNANDRDYEAMQLLASGYLRLGKEKEGTKWLYKAWRGDEFNTRTYNLLDLFEKVIPKQYTVSKGTDLNFRFHKDESKVLERVIRPYLEDAYQDMIRRYSYKPTASTMLELYRESEHYGVRTIGLPGLGALGICFGQVVTALSPSVGNINWAMVLWHEMSHVFALQLSNYRVPRWYTEGLSEYETIRARPEWRRENDADLWDQLQDGSLPGVAELDHAFMGNGVLLAYHQSSVTIEYIVAEYGFEKIVEGLRLFGKGLDTKAVIPKITGRSVAQFDAEFGEHLKRRLAPYKNALQLPKISPEEYKGLDDRAAKAPEDSKLQEKLAMAYFNTGNVPKALATAQKILEKDKNNGTALFVSGGIYFAKKKVDLAKASYEAILKQGIDSADVRIQLSRIAAAKQDEKAFVGHLQSIKAIDPENPYPYEKLAEFYKAKEEKEKMLAELEHYVMIEQMEFVPLFDLVKEFSAQKKWNKVLHYGEMALFINPFQSQLHFTIAQAQLELKNYSDALDTYDTALAIRPIIRRPAQAYLGRAKALKGLGKGKEAKKALRDALDVEPENLEALKLEQAWQ